MQANPAPPGLLLRPLLLEIVVVGVRVGVVAEVVEIGRILRDIAGYCGTLQDIAEYCKDIIQNTTGYCRILRDITRYCRILQDIAGYCRILQDIAGYCRIKRDITGVGVSAWSASESASA
jgi:hypothetical protein